MKPTNSNIQQWHKICNMRTTLLHLQYLHAQLTQNLQLQQQKFNLNHKDRLIQYYELHQQKQQLTSNNFKIILITKIESLLAACGGIDQLVWQNLEQFLYCVRYLEEQMSRDVCKLYIGDKIMLDIGKCQKQLKLIQQKIVNYMNENQSTIQQYNNNIKQLAVVSEMWEKYLKQVLIQVREKIQPHYVKYLRRKLEAKEKQLLGNIQVLKQFIKS